MDAIDIIDLLSADAKEFLQLGLLPAELKHISFEELSKQKFYPLLQKIKKRCYSEACGYTVLRFLGPRNKYSSKRTHLICNRGPPVTRVYYELRSEEKNYVAIRILDMLAEQGPMNETSIRKQLKRSYSRPDTSLEHLVNGNLLQIYDDGHYKLTELGKSIFNIEAIWEKFRKSGFYKPLFKVSR